MLPLHDYDELLCYKTNKVNITYNVSQSKSNSISNNIIVGFFIPVSSLKVFGHSIHSEMRRIYLGRSIHALQNEHYHIMNIQFQGHPANSA